MKLEITTTQGTKLTATLNMIPGVSAKANPEGVEVKMDAKSKSKVKDVLLKNGFDKVDIKDAYPELLESSAKYESLQSFRDFIKD